MNNHPDLKMLLTKSRPVAELRPAEEFWRDFKNQAHAIRRERPAVLPAYGLLRLRWATSGVAMALALVALTVYFWPARTGELSRIQGLSVVSRHSSVFIINDDEHRGTILWVGGMQEM